MPRRARVYIPGLPYHIVQRGNNREACFIEPENYQFYLDLWRELSVQYHCQVHAYCLMTNHIHFLVTPESKSTISDTMKVVGSRYASYINRRYDRTGTLWEGRHRSSLIQSERYLLTCMRYIELNPVRAGMVERPEAYRWSSYGFNAYGDTGWLQQHERYMSLGSSSEGRCFAYRELFRTHLDGQDISLIRQAAHYCQPVGDNRFRKQIEQRYGIRVGQMRRGRPRKDEE
jgi:putative transposase